MKYKGQNLIEFIIILSLVVIGAVLALTLLGGNVNTLFGKITNIDPLNINAQNQNFASNNSSNQFSQSEIEKLSAGDLGGTADKPVEKCYNGDCIIDFGEFILKGVPENFDELVQTTGVSGGTDSLISLARQIADQLAMKGLNNESLEIKKFASLGHNIASLENEYEKMMISCNNDMSCALNFQDQCITKPINFDDTYYPYKTSTYYGLMDLVPVGYLKSVEKNDPNCYNIRVGRNDTAALFVSKYNSLMKDSNITDATKGVLQELYWQVGKLSEDVRAGITSVKYINCYKNAYNDPITGEQITNPDLPADPFSIFDGHKPSSLSHVNSALICAAGYNKDTGTKCH